MIGKEGQSGAPWRRSLFSARLLELVLLGAADERRQRLLHASARTSIDHDLALNVAERALRRDCNPEFAEPAGSNGERVRTGRAGFEYVLIKREAGIARVRGCEGSRSIVGIDKVDDYRC